MSDKTKKENTEDQYYFACFNCKIRQYCPDCSKGYGKDDKFCSLCGKPLVGLENFVDQDCPICSKKKGLGNFHKIMKTADVKIDYSKEMENFFRPRGGGVIMPSYCNCGNYRPCSTRGVIDDSCANCGGKHKPVILR